MRDYFDCELRVLYTVQSKESQEKEYAMNNSVQLRTVSPVFVNEICTFSGANIYTSACVTIEY